MVSGREDIAIAADAEETLPYLIEACRKLITADHRRAYEARGAKLGPALRAAIDVVKRDEPALIDVVTQPR